MRPEGARKGALMTKGKRIAGQLRWFLLVVWVLCLVCGIGWVLGPVFLEHAGIRGTPSTALFGPLQPDFDDSNDWGHILLGFVYVSFLFFTQWMFLRPRSVWKIKQEQVGRPMKRAAIGAAFAAMLLSVGLLYSMLDLFGAEVFKDSRDSYGGVDVQLTGVCRLFFFLIPLILWCFWGVIFCIYWRKSNYNTWLGRVVRGLIAGSVMEFFVAIPIYAKSQESCFCARGSYAGLVFGGTVLLWAFGPGVFILFLKEKHRREILSNGSSAKTTALDGIE